MTWLRVAGFLVIAVFLAACGSAPSTPLTTAVLSPAVQPTAAQSGPTSTSLFVISADCTRPRLETWLARSSSLMKDFKNTVNQNLAATGDALAQPITNLTIIRGALFVGGAPGCAEPHLQRIDNATNKAIDLFTRRQNNQAPNFVAEMSDLNILFNEIDAYEKALKAFYLTLP